MFEYEQDIVQALRRDDESFKELFEQHHKLDEQVRDAELGVLPLDDYALEDLKKEKLRTKDRLAAMLARYRREHPVA